MQPTLNPYLNFNGNAAEAMKFYHSVLGGDLDIQTFEDAGMAKDDSEKDRTLHAALTAEAIHLYASDGHPEMAVKFGDSVHLCIQGSDEELLTKWFNGLSEGGRVDMPLAKQFWGDTYGQLTDQFGIHWMVNILAKKE